MSNIMAMIFAVSMSLGILATSMINLHQLDSELEITKQSSFIDRHSKTISRLGNVLLLLWIGFLFYLSMRIPAQISLKLLKESQPVGRQQVCYVISTLLWGITGFIGMAGAFAGFLSIFQCHITRTKRIVLLIIFLLPIILTTANLLIRHHLGPSSIDIHLIIQLGLWSSFVILLSNGTTIIFGKHIMILGTMGLHKIIALMKKPLV